MNSKLLVALSLAALLAGCATNAGEPAVALVEEEPAVSATQEEAPAAPAVVEHTVKLVAVERSLFADGTLDEYDVWAYEPDGVRPLTRTRFDSLDVVRDMSTYEYDGDTTRITDTDANGNITRIRIENHSPEGDLVEERVLDSAGNLQTINSYVYEAGRKTVWEVFDGSEVLRSTTVYSYEGDQLTRIDNYSPGGVLEDYFLLEYDGSNLTREDHFIGSELDGYVTYEYDGDKRVARTEYRGKSTILRRREYSYDGDVVSEELLLGRDGQVRARTEYEYVERTIQEPVNG